MKKFIKSRLRRILRLYPLIILVLLTCCIYLWLKVEPFEPMRPIGSPTTTMQKVDSSLLSVFLGALLGYATSISTWRVQKRDERRRLARGYLFEVEKRHKELAGWVTILKNARNPPPGYNGPRGAMPIKSALYPEDGLFHETKKEALAYDDDLSSALFDYYQNLLNAERLRRTELPQHVMTFVNEGIEGSLDAAVKRTPELIRLLKLELGR